jgi:hypothetical protein
MSIKKHFGILAALSCAASIAATTAQAAPPASVRGTWTILTGTTFSTLEIAAQGGAGAPGASECRHITGTIDIADIRGFYCPKSGRIHFLHFNYSTDAPVRSFTGAVSLDSTGAMHMAGTYNVLAVAFGDLGEQPFSATR